MKAILMNRPPLPFPQGKSLKKVLILGRYSTGPAEGVQPRA